MSENDRMMGPYIVGETLGEGGFSKVRLGTHKDTGQKVALKILKKDKLALSSSVKKQVEREITAMGKVKHPNVIQLISVDWESNYGKKSGSSENVILVILELATGGELFEFLSFTGCFEEAIARTYFHQLMAGVEACHKQGIAHRDLKPENLLLDNNFMLKLADFGFSNVFKAQATTMYTECGTPGYMSPEMFGGKGYDPQCADIWACGVILFIMLAGFPPFQRPNKTDWWFDKLQKGKHALFWQAHCRSAYFSDDTKDFINKILTPEPAKRITIQQMKKHPWFAGNTIKDAALRSEMQRRKDTVDEEKARERLEQKAQGCGSFEADKQRGIGDAEVNAEDFPSAPPSMANFRVAGGAVPSVPTASVAAMSIGSGSDDPFGGGSMSPFAQAVEQKAGEAEPYRPADGIACYTRFYTNAEPSKVVTRVSDVVASMHGQYSVKKENYKLKGSVVTPLGMVDLRAQVFEDKDQNMHVVEFRRYKGDAMQYRRVYEDIRAALKDIVVPLKPKAEVAAQ